MYLLCTLLRMHRHQSNTHALPYIRVLVRILRTEGTKLPYRSSCPPCTRDASIWYPRHGKHGRSRSSVTWPFALTPLLEAVRPPCSLTNILLIRQHLYSRAQSLSSFRIGPVGPLLPYSVYLVLLLKSLVMKVSSTQCESEECRISAGERD